MFGSDKIANILESIHTKTTAKIKDGKTQINIDAGVRQGSDEGPGCFNTYFEYVLLAVERDLEQKFIDKFGKKPGVEFSFNIKSEIDNNDRRKQIFTGETYGIERLLRLLYADDLVLFAESIEELQFILDILAPIFDRFGLIIAEDKTKSMALNVEYDETPIVKLNLTDEHGEIISTPLEHVDAFTYLGHRASSTDKDMFLKSLTQAGWSAFNKNSKTLESRKIALKTRISLLNSLVRSVMLYSSQATNHTQAQVYRFMWGYNNMMAFWGPII